MKGAEKAQSLSDLLESFLRTPELKPFHLYEGFQSSDLPRRSLFHHMKGFQGSDLCRRIYEGVRSSDHSLYERVRSSDRSTYMKRFQSSDLPRRMFHLYEGVRSSDRSTYEGVPELSHWRDPLAESSLVAAFASFILACFSVWRKGVLQRPLLNPTKVEVLKFKE